MEEERVHVFGCYRRKWRKEIDEGSLGEWKVYLLLPSGQI
jgi:hypothetical protein